MTASKKTIAVLGDAGSTNPTIAGGGSGHVNPPYIITPLSGSNSFSLFIFISISLIVIMLGITNRVGTAGKVVYAPTNPIATAVEVAKSADYAVVFVGFTSSEGSDRYYTLSPLPSINNNHFFERGNLSLPAPQDELITSVAAANPNTIVVLNGPGPVLMPWASQVKAIVFGFFPGQESGTFFYYYSFFCFFC